MSIDVAECDFSEICYLAARERGMAQRENEEEHFAALGSAFASLHDFRKPAFSEIEFHFRSPR